MTQAEMVAEIAKAMTRVPTKDGPVGVSAREYAEARGFSVDTARKELITLTSAGKVKCVGKALRPSLCGDWRPVPVYAPVKGK